MIGGYASYQWLTSPGFLLPAVVTSSIAIEAAPDDEPHALVQSLPAGTSWFHFHLNCTKTARFPLCRDDLLAQLRDRGVRTVNAAVTDISKQRVQAACAEAALNQTAAPRSGDPDELLIVKTDLNFGGDSEWALTAEDRDRLALGQGSNVMWKPNDYRIVRRSEVPDGWWNDVTLVQERYVVNRDDRWYRVFVFLSRMVVVELVDPTQIKKVGHSTVTQTWMFDRDRTTTWPADIGGAVGEAVARFADVMSVEFGAIDVVVDDRGSPYIIDVNTTPAYTYPIPGLAEYLRDGLQS